MDRSVPGMCRASGPDATGTGTLAVGSTLARRVQSEPAEPQIVVEQFVAAGRAERNRWQVVMVGAAKMLDQDVPLHCSLPVP